MKNCYFPVIFLWILLAGCVKQYKRTIRVCDNKLYLEIFNVNPAGIDSHYLTDSLNFRLYVGKFDNEHENFHYACEGDSLFIERIASIDTTGKMTVMETRVYNLIDLKKKRKFE